MNNPKAIEFLCGLEGTEVTLDPPSEPQINLSRQTWIIDKKLSERAQWMTQKEVDDGVGVPLTRGKFICHLKENPSKMAFMRIFLQIPITGTQFLSAQIRQKQAAIATPAYRVDNVEGVKRVRMHCCS